MTTTELTGAEEVAWDLSDLYEGSDDPRIEADIDEADEAAAAFRDRYHGKVAGLTRRGARGRDRASASGSRRSSRASSTSPTSTSPPTWRIRRGARSWRASRRRAPRSTRSSSSSVSRSPSSTTTSRRRCSPSAELERWTHWLRSLRKFRPYLLSEPEEKIVTEKTVSGVSAWGRLYEELLGALRVVTRRGRDRVRGGDVEALLGRSRHAARGGRGGHRVRSSRACGPARSSSTRSSLDKSIDDRLRGYPTWISSRQPPERHDRRGRPGARRRDRVALRRRPALLPPEGEADRSRPARVLRPHGADRRGPEQGLVGRRPGHRRRRVRRLLAGGRRHRRALLQRELDRRACRATTSGPARSARRTSPASTRTSS